MGRAGSDLALDAADLVGHEGSTVIVGLNGPRLLRASTWPAART